ncbi:MAG: hypothetical protein QOC81_1123 [Thermoanaerobaculia bacterium]|jgi:hypothetical protein|nr:hypothetical protein [Thermoanaerobaculia bacterium]
MFRERLTGTNMKIYELLQKKEAMGVIASDSSSSPHMNVASVTGRRATVPGKICL